MLISIINKKQGVLITLVLVIFIFPVLCTAQRLTIDTLLKIVETRNPEFRMYDAQINAYDSYASGARSLEAPQVGAGFFMTPYNPAMWKGDGAMSNMGMGSFMISAQQMFTNPKKLNANASYMQGMSSIEKEQKKNVRNEMFTMAKMNYSELQILSRKLKVLKESEDLISYIIKTTEIRYKYGLDKINAYYKAKAMQGETEKMRLMTEIEIKQLKVLLNTLMFRDKNYEFDVDTTIVYKNYENTPFDSVNFITNRSGYKVLTNNINLLKAKQTYEQAKLLPDFGIRYDHMFSFGSQPQLFTLMAMVSIPIAPWSSKMYRSTVKGMNFELQALQSQQQSYINTSSGNIERIKAQIRNKKGQVMLYEKNILPAFEKNYRVTLLAYEQNTEELFMVLDAWQNLKTTQLGYLDLLNDLIQLQVEFEKELEINNKQ